MGLVNLFGISRATPWHGGFFGLYYRCSLKIWWPPSSRQDGRANRFQTQVCRPHIIEWQYIQKPWFCERPGFWFFITICNYSTIPNWQNWQTTFINLEQELATKELKINQTPWAISPTRDFDCSVSWPHPHPPTAAMWKKSNLLSAQQFLPSYEPRQVLAWKVTKFFDLS